MKGTLMITKAKMFCALAVLSMVSGCGTTYPVVAISKETGEKFFGTATSVAGGTSRVELQNAKGVKCSGTYKASIVFDYTTGGSTSGTFTCSDGRSGRYVTTGTAIGGQGQGTVDGKPVAIYYGQFASFQQFD